MAEQIPEIPPTPEIPDEGLDKAKAEAEFPRLKLTKAGRKEEIKAQIKDSHQDSSLRIAGSHEEVVPIAEIASVQPSTPERYIPSGEQRDSAFAEEIKKQGTLIGVKQSEQAFEVTSMLGTMPALGKDEKEGGDKKKKEDKKKEPLLPPAPPPREYNAKVRRQSLWGKLKGFFR